MKMSHSVNRFVWTYQFLSYCKPPTFGEGRFCTCDLVINKTLFPIELACQGMFWCSLYHQNSHFWCTHVFNMWPCYQQNSLSNWAHMLGDVLMLWLNKKPFIPSLFTPCANTIWQVVAHFQSQIQLVKWRIFVDGYMDVVTM